MKIAIIGSGNVGSAIARAVSEANHEVLISEEGEGSEELSAELGVTASPSNLEAARAADLVVLALPFGAVESIAEDLAEAVAGKVVIDVTNPLNEDYSGLVTDAGPSGAERVQKKMPQARVVKAFNTIFASNQDKGEVEGIQLDGFVAGDDAEAKRQVMSILEQIGFRPIDAGPLASARYLEAMGFLNIALNAANDWQWQTGWKLVGPTT